jgi:adenosylhomocysteine nucleosidase
MGKDIFKFPVEQAIGLPAVYNEAIQLKKLMTVQATTKAVYATFHWGLLNGHNVVLAEMGQGKIHAAAATQYLIDHYNITMLINWGTTGAIAPYVNVGDIVLAERVIPHDSGWYTGDGFTHLGVYNSAIPDGRHYRREWLSPKPHLLAAKQALAETQWTTTAPAVHTGTLASGDQVIASAAKKEWLFTTFNALAVEMESAAVAQVAHLNGIPWLVLRAVSDQADASLDINIAEFITYDETPARPTKEMVAAAAQAVKNPGQLSMLNELRRGLKLAAGNAAVAVAAIVEKLPA